MKRIKIGEVGVDSGQLLVCDPCYIDSSWEKEDFDGKDAGPSISQFSYNACCKKTLADDEQYDGQLYYDKDRKSAGIGVTFSSGYGDGCYPVYGHFNSEGRCVKVEILMDCDE